MNRETEPDGSRKYYRIQMQKVMIQQKMKELGCRITKQRIIILDVILSENCTSCKEIYYLALKEDPGIGTATVYRMVNLLEEIGAISPGKRYEITCTPAPQENVICAELDDDSVVRLSGKDLNSVIQEGLKACGDLGQRNVVSVSVENEDT